MLCEPDPSGSDAEPAAPEPSGDWRPLLLWVLGGSLLIIIVAAGILVIAAVGCEGGESDWMEQGEP